MRRAGGWTLWLVVACLLVGCAATGSDSRGAQVDDVSPEARLAAERMHDLCYWLLYYHARHDALPARLSDLAQHAPAETVQTWRCPVTDQPFRYLVPPAPSPQHKGDMIVHDSGRAYPGHLIAIVASVSDEGALVLRVVTVASGPGRM